MNAEWIFEIWTSGDFDETLTLATNSGVQNQVETYLTKKDSGDYAHAYIAEVCTEDGDQVLCGLNDENTAPSVAFVGPGTINVTVGLRTTGGNHRSAGMICTI
ncbi:MAG TPA: hypothetical protein VGS08_01795 [Candidatus Saccharimonadales bacterium]|nr:hypothetical protein [Candidatus Saccharimonadales bacterium]